MFRGTVVKVDGKVVVGERADTVGLGVSTCINGEHANLHNIQTPNSTIYNTNKFLRKLFANLVEVIAAQPHISFVYKGRKSY